MTYYLCFINMERFRRNCISRSIFNEIEWKFFLRKAYLMLYKSMNILYGSQKTYTTRISVRKPSKNWPRSVVSATRSRMTARMPPSTSTLRRCRSKGSWRRMGLRSLLLSHLCSGLETRTTMVDCCFLTTKSLILSVGGQNEGARMWFDEFSPKWAK